MITVLIPAHNEETGIGLALDSLMSQVQPEDKVIVVCDNCTDSTAEIALDHGCQVFETIDNTAKKAGGLNQVMMALLPSLQDSDYVMVMDADSMIDEGFLTAARAHFQREAGLGGVSGTFRGGSGGRFVGWCQRNEYARYARDVRRLKGKALVLTGTASLFRVRALRDIQTGRIEGRLPDGGGKFYDERVLTEDNELTLALMHCGWKILAPKDCLLTTEVMPTWRDLARQRLRWKRGALENLIDYPLNRITAPYWGRQILSLVAILATFIYLGTLIYGAANYSVHIQPFWILVTIVFCLERCVSVRDRGWRIQLIALLLLPEMVCDIFLQAVQARAFINVALRRTATW